MGGFGDHEPGRPFGEDKYAFDHFFYGVHNGTFLEIGAGNEGKGPGTGTGKRVVQVTAAFGRELGWHGILVDGSTTWYETEVSRHHPQGPDQVRPGTGT